MSGHTPGPWVFDGRGLVHGKNHVLVGSVSYLDELKANGRLIAAAPDLLEALFEAYVAFSHDCDGPVWSDSLIAKAKSAIAKAEGSQP